MQNKSVLTFDLCLPPLPAIRVHAVEPYKKELSIDNLADILRNYRLRDPNSRTVNPLLYLYPDTPMDQAFGQYYTKPGSTAS